MAGRTRTSNNNSLFQALSQNANVSGQVGVSSEQKSDPSPIQNEPMSKTIKSFCQNISVLDPPDDVTAAIEIAKRNGKSYVQCQGTTTVFVDKNCFHRQCFCITQKEAKVYQAGDSLFSKSEIEVLSKRGLLQKTYQICHRHAPNLRIPFEYLKQLGLESELLDEAVRGGIIKIRKISRKEEDTELEDLIDQISVLVPYLSRIRRQEAADARSSLKLAIDNIIDANADNLPGRKNKLERIVNEIYSQINGQENMITKTELQESRKKKARNQ